MDKTEDNQAGGLILMTISKGINDKSKGQTPSRGSSLQKKEFAVDIKYHEIYSHEKNPVWLRERMVKYAGKHSIKAAARHFQCSRNTIRRWIREPSDCYANKSRANHSYKRIPVEHEKLILDCWENEHMGALNLKHQYELAASVSTINRVLKRNDKLHKRKRKHKRSKDLRALKAKQKCFEVVQVDGKVLNDIPEFYPFYLKYKLPLWQFTFTCEKSGATFYCYCQSENSIAACTFLVYVLEHLKRYGIEVQKVRTDRGSFAVGSRSTNFTAFQKLVRQTYKLKHRPIRHKNQNSDVERFHGLVEQYFYQISHIKSKQHFYEQAVQKQIWFNFIRKNGGKKWQTPLQILKQDYPGIDPQVLALAPIDLDKHYSLYRYKIDPTYQPLTFESFFQDVPEHLLDFIKPPQGGHNEMNIDGGFLYFLRFIFDTTDKLVQTHISCTI